MIGDEVVMAYVVDDDGWKQRWVHSEGDFAW